jgi:type IV pilus assembly protein PilP
VKQRFFAACALTVAPSLALGCGTPTTTAPPPVNHTAASAAASASVAPPTTKGPDYTENDFVESDRNRDPFRTYVLTNQSSAKPILNQRKVELSQYAIDELKLVAIVTGSDQPRAMFVDPTSRGTVVYPGTFLCRPEIVHVGGPDGPEYQLNWRVERIREGEVVLIREDPAQPGIPPATRVIPLHPEVDKQALAP